jgi:phage gpG-like protein
MLQRRGDLLGSIGRLEAAADEISVGSRLEYAPILHFGGVTALKTTIPARPFISLSDEVIDETMEQVAAYFLPDALGAELSGA